MNLLLDHLRDNKDAILDTWFEVVIGAYPQETQATLRDEQDPFLNPVARAFKATFEGILGILLKDDKPSGEVNSLFDPVVDSMLDPIIRIRAVQDMPPSQALGFVFGLKKILRSHLEHFAANGSADKEWAAIDSKIDAVALAGFDIYMRCKERIYDIRVQAAHRKTSGLLRMAGLKQVGEAGGYDEPG